jgi:CRP-like cAMP-binding protein
VFWQSAFVLINVVHVALLLLARRPTRLTADQQILRDMVFRNFTSRETRKVLELATWHTGVPNEVLIVGGQQEPVLYLLQHGRAEIVRNGKVIDWNGPGAFMGELRFITGEPAVADVVFTTETLYVSWNTEELKKLLEKNSRLKTAFEALISANIATKLGNRGSLNQDGQISGDHIRVA